MNGKDCRAMRREIDQSELGQRLSDQAEIHLAACGACAQFRAERSHLRELVGSLAPVAAPADFDVRLRARIARENAAHSSRSVVFRFAMSTPGIAVAALAVMLVAAVVWVNQRTPTQSSNTTTANSGALPAVPKNPVVTSDNRTGSETERVVATAIPTDSPQPSNPTRQNPRKAPVFNETRTSDFNSSQAQSIRMAQDRAGEVSLTAPVNPMVISVRDSHGGTRRIMLPPVSFGSQRMTDNRIPVAMSNGRDW